MEFAKIWLFSIVAAIVYGIVHAQVTAHICVEYFSIAHPTILPLTSPTLLALQWGVVATWWVGAALGFGLAASSRWGSRPPVRARNVMRPIAILLVSMAVASFVSGIAGFALAKTHAITLSGWLALAIPESRHARFMADWWAHSAAYLVGILGGAILCVRTYAERRHAAAMTV
jgi:hypothetical protein